MNRGERRLELLSRILGPVGELATQRLCDVCADVTGATGAGIMLMSGDIPIPVSVTRNSS